MSKKRSVDRRDFLKHAAVTGAAAMIPGSMAGAQVPSPAQPASAAQGQRPAQGSAPTAPREVDPSGDVEVLTTDRPGGDFMVDVIKSLELRVRRRQPGLELPRPARIDHQLRRQPGAGVHHVLPRRVVGRDGARLLQGRRQADGRARATAPSACSTRRWRSTTRTATACPSTSSPATRSMRRSGGPASSGRTACRTRRRWSATSSSGTTCRSRCRTSPNRPCAPTRSR